jgi:hypothetical protein
VVDYLSDAGAGYEEVVDWVFEGVECVFEGMEGFGRFFVEGFCSSR